jgi:hypothetical protein
VNLCVREGKRSGPAAENHAALLIDLVKDRHVLSFLTLTAGNQGSLIIADFPSSETFQPPVTLLSYRRCMY